MRDIKGLTLIEMMIAITLGLIIILGLSSIYLSSKKSAGTRDAVSNMEANARIALSSLRQIIQHAGYPSIYNIPLEKPFHSLEDGMIDTSIQCRGGTKTLILPSSIANKHTIDNAGRDQIVVKYMADNQNDPNAEIISDCSGGLVPTECSADPDKGMYDSMQAIVYNAIYITTHNGREVLTCAGSRNTIPQPIAEDISFIQFLYGINQGSTMTYKTATEVETAKEWESVNSVQIAILVRSNKELLQRAESRSFVLLDQTVNRTDKYLYRVYSTTVHLPNRNRRVL